MATATNIILLILCTSFILFALQINTTHSPYVYLNQTFRSSFINDANSVAANSTGNTLAGTLTFPNAFTFFANTFLMLISFVTFPISFFQDNQLPPDVGMFLGVTFLMLSAIAIIAWLKGGGEP